jgi:uncharacterized protein YraI
MFGKYLTLAGALAEALVWSAAAQAAPGETTGNVIMRSGPGAAYAVVGRIPAGAPVNILNCRRWCELGYGGQEGYVSANAVVAEYAPAQYASERYPLVDDFYDQNEPDAVSSRFGAHDHADVHDGEVYGRGGMASNHGVGAVGHGGGQERGRR